MGSPRQRCQRGRGVSARTWDVPRAYSKWHRQVLGLQHRIMSEHLVLQSPSPTCIWNSSMASSQVFFAFICQKSLFSFAPGKFINNNIWSLSPSVGDLWEWHNCHQLIYTVRHRYNIDAFLLVNWLLLTESFSQLILCDCSMHINKTKKLKFLTPDIWWLLWAHSFTLHK